MSKINRFIGKRAAAILIVLLAADVALLGDHRWLVLTGIFAGAFISLARFSSNEWLLKKVFGFSGKGAAAGSIVLFTINQLILVPVIVLTYLLSVWVLLGLVAGILIVPLSIMVNSVTEVFGITKNNFE